MILKQFISVFSLLALLRCLLLLYVGSTVFGMGINCQSSVNMLTVKCDTFINLGRTVGEACAIHFSIAIAVARARAMDRYVCTLCVSRGRRTDYAKYSKIRFLCLDRIG